MKPEMMSKIQERAKKKDKGVYCCDGVHYYVSNNKAVIFCEYTSISQLEQGWLVSLGTIKSSWDAKKELKRLGEKYEKSKNDNT